MRTVQFHHLFLAAGAALLLAAVAPPPQETENLQAARAVATGADELSPTGLPVVSYARGDVSEEDLGEANRIASQVLSYIEAHYSDLASVRVFRVSTDELWTYHFFFEHETLMAYRQSWQRQASDEGWQALWDEFIETFVLDGRRLMTPLGGADLVHAPRRLYRRTRSSYANLPRAYQLAREVAAHMGATYGIRVTVYADQLNDPGAIHWFEEYDLGIHMRAVRARLLEDERYIELFDGADELFLEDEYSEEMLYELL
jgi:hypothetical protein